MLIISIFDLTPPAAPPQPWKKCEKVSPFRRVVMPKSGGNYAIKTYLCGNVRGNGNEWTTARQVRSANHNRGGRTRGGSANFETMP